MASFDRYKQTPLGVEKVAFPSMDTRRAVSKGDTVYLPAGSALPDDIDRLKIVNGTLVSMSAQELTAQAQAREQAEADEIEETVSRPDAQVDVLGAVVLEQINELRTALNLAPVTLQDMKQRARQIARGRRRASRRQ